MEKWARKTDGGGRAGAYLFERFKRKQVNTKGWWERGRGREIAENGRESEEGGGVSVAGSDGE